MLFPGNGQTGICCVPGGRHAAWGSCMEGCVPRLVVMTERMDGMGSKSKPDNGQQGETEPRPVHGIFNGTPASHKL